MASTFTSGHTEKPMTDKSFERYCNALAFISVYFVAAGFAVPFFASSNNFLITLAGFVTVLVIMLAGYWLQALVCKLSGFKRRQDDGLYESNIRYFDIGRSAMAIVIIGILGFLLFPVFGNIYYAIAMNTPGMEYDELSVLPLFLSAIVIIFMVAGSVIWFYPYQRFALLRFPFVCIPILLIAFVFSVQFGGGAGVSTAICLFGYILCMLILMNQGTISRRYGSADRVSFMNGRSRGYNVAMTSLLLPLLLLAAALAYIIIGGLTVLGRMAFLAIFLASNAPAEGGYHFTADNLGGFLFGAKLGERAAYSTSFTLFLLLGTLVLLVLAMRRTSWMVSFLRGIKRLFERIIEFFMSFFEVEFFKRYSEEEDCPACSFKDEEKRHQRAVINPYVKKAEATRSYRDFVIKLNGFKYSDEKVQFAYTTLVTQLYRAGKYIKKADTPRQIAHKLKSDPNYQGIDGITEAFEIVAYADRDLTSDRAEQALSTLCGLLRRHLS